MNYPTADAEEAGLASELRSDALKVSAVHCIAHTRTLGKDVRVWVAEVDSLKRVTDANPLIHKSRRYAGRYTYLLLFTDYERFLWVHPQGQVIYKLWMDRKQVYHSDLRTLSLLRLPSPQANWLEILSAWRSAFDVERVTNEFYRDFVAAQQKLQEAIRQPGLTEEQKFEYAQLLMGRLMFLYFLQKKGWLGQEGQGKASGGRLVADENYLQRKFQEVCARSQGKAFHAKFLKPLFFDVLCQPRRDRSASLTRQFGEIPFLNGGLFHKGEVEKAYPDLEIRDEGFADMLGPETGLFRRYNFTVREDEPLDRQVAVDPEMLGKIFEQQVVGKEVKGAFYTPAPVVDYMCREALKAYVLAHAGGEGDTPVAGGGPAVGREALLDLFEMSPAEELERKSSRVGRLSDAEAVRLDDLLDGLTIIDPAVGSGAFPVGMLHQLVDLRCALIRRSPAVARDRVRLLNAGLVGKRGPRLGGTAPPDSQLRYVLKRRIIQRNLFGVDIERYAIQIAQLRLWLSLAVEHEVEFVDDIQPLPNLDFNLVVGNSLIDTFHPPGSREALDLETDIRKAKPGSALARIAGQIHQRTLAFTDIEDEGEKERELQEIQHLHRELLREQLRQALKDIPAKIEAVKKEFLFDGMGDERVAYLEHQAAACRKALAALDAGGEIEGSALPMLWQLRFPQAFAERGGFDVCIANPPYVSTQGASELAYIPALKDKVGFNDDFYVFFAYRALGHPEPERMPGVTRPGGVVCFITSDTYFTLNTKEHLRALLQDKRLLKIGQVDPFRATVDAAIFVAHNRPRIDGEAAELFQARFVESQDELAGMADRVRADESRWGLEAEFQVAEPETAAAGRTQRPKPVPAWRDQTLGALDGATHKRKGLWRYRVDPVVWRAALKRVIFEPSARNAALYNRFMAPVVKLVDEWWNCIETSTKFEKNLARIRAYHKTLKPGDVTLVGLICEGGQGMRTANNGRFLGYLEGTPQAEGIERRQDELRQSWAADPRTARTYQRLAREHRDFPELADAMKEEFKDWTGALGLRRGEIYRVVPRSHVVEVEALTAAEKKNGINAARKCWVPFRKGDPEGNKWVSFDPLYIFWRRENVEWLFKHSGRPEANMPVIRNAHLYFTEGITWTAVANHVPLKARIQPKCAFDADSMRLTPVSGTISAFAFLALLNANLLSYIKWRFLKNTQKYEIGDLRLLPIIVPTKEQESQLDQLAKRAIQVQTDVLQNGCVSRQPELDAIQAQVNEAVEELYGVKAHGPFNEF